MLTTARNVVAPDASSSIYVDARNGDLRVKEGQAIRGRGVAIGSDSLDLCGQSYGEGSYGEGSPDIGPIRLEPQNGCEHRLW